MNFPLIDSQEAPNVITANSVMDMNVRSATIDDTLVLKKRAMKCFEGAATATGCTVEFEEFVSFLFNFYATARNSLY